MQYVFFFLVFIAFYSPVNSASFFGFSSIMISSSEIAFLFLPLVNLLIDRKNKIELNLKYINVIGISFIAYIVAIEFVKEIMIEGSIVDYLKSLRLSLPLLSSLTILITGLRVDIKKLWNILLITILVSNIISLFAFFFEIIQFLPPEESYTSFGRLYNSNLGFGLIGLYLLFESKKVWYNKGWLPFIVALFSFSGILLSGNRTFFIVIVLYIIIIGFRKYSIKILLRGSFLTILAFVAFYILYSNNKFIEYQINKRVLPLVTGDISVLEDSFYGTREIIFSDSKKKIESGYWVVGLPYSKEIFEYGNDIYRRSGRGKMRMTDTSLINLLLRYGIIALTLFLVLFFVLYRENYLKINKSYIFLYTFPFYFIAAFNLDELVQHNSILFIIISLYITRNESTVIVNQPLTLEQNEISPNSQNQAKV